MEQRIPRHLTREPPWNYRWDRERQTRRRDRRQDPQRHQWPQRGPHLSCVSLVAVVIAIPAVASFLLRELTMSISFLAKFMSNRSRHRRPNLDTEIKAKQTTKKTCRHLDEYVTCSQSFF